MNNIINWKTYIFQKLSSENIFMKNERNCYYIYLKNNDNKRLKVKLVKSILDKNGTPFYRICKKYKNLITKFKPHDCDVIICVNEFTSDFFVVAIEDTFSFKASVVEKYITKHKNELAIAYLQKKINQII